MKQSKLSELLPEFNMPSKSCLEHFEGTQTPSLNVELVKCLYLMNMFRNC